MPFFSLAHDLECRAGRQFSVRPGARSLALGNQVGDKFGRGGIVRDDQAFRAWRRLFLHRMTRNGSIVRQAHRYTIWTLPNLKKGKRAPIIVKTMARLEFGLYQWQMPQSNTLRCNLNAPPTLARAWVLKARG